MIQQALMNALEDFGKSREVVIVAGDVAYSIQAVELMGNFVAIRIDASAHPIATEDASAGAASDAPDARPMAVNPQAD